MTQPLDRVDRDRWAEIGSRLHVTGKHQRDGIELSVFNSMVTGSMRGPLGAVSLDCRKPYAARAQDIVSSWKRRGRTCLVERDGEEGTVGKTNLS